MNETQRGSPPAGMSLQDILYILFRNKGKILGVLVLGVALAAFLPRLSPIPYESEAKLYIRYVMESTAPNQLSENGSRINRPDNHGDSVINTELEILTSRDLADQVAAAIAAERLLGKGPTNSVELSARAIQNGLQAELVRDSSVVRLVFQNRDPALVRAVLSQLINSYFKKHAEIHAVGAFDEFLTQETDQLRSRLVQTEEELRKAKAKAGIISVEDTKNAYSEEISKIQQGLLDAEAELAERRASASAMATLLHPSQTASTNETVPLSYPPPPDAKLTEYKRICALLESLRRREQELLVTFTPANSWVKDVERQIGANEQTKKQLEAEFPGLLASRVSETNPLAPSDPTAGPRADLVMDMARANALESKVKVLTSQLEDIRKRAASAAEAEGAITELERQRDLEENHYRKFSENLAQSQLDEKLGAGKVSNISVIEEPTPPQKAKTKMDKVRLGVLLGSMAVAFGLAFLIELYLDQTVKRPSDVESKLGLPLFIDIPMLARNGHARSSNGKSAEQLKETNGDTSKSNGAETAAGMEVALWGHGHPLRSYCDALRDRLIHHFEVKLLTHKPKLIGVTSCAQGAGVSTTAAELAASLSETGEGNVLLVNMNRQNGEAHHFHKGELAVGLEAVLEMDKRGEALVQENLYVVSECTPQEQLAPVLPKRFKQLLPRIKASDFDYIIFDMPPINQVSVTPRLAKYMDFVLMVVESEKTSRDVVQKASALLAASNGDVGVVLNKGRKYVPGWLSQDI